MEKGIKEKIFPEITDWFNPMNKYRYAKVKDLTYKQWFWFHPSAYKLLNYGISVIGIICFLPLLLWLFFRGNYVLMIIPGILLVGNIISLIKKLKNQVAPNSNFYDFQMREYF